MKPNKQTKVQRIAELERKLRAVEATQVHRHHFVSKEIHKASTTKMMGSGVILSLQTIGGVDIFEPVLIFNGLSDATIEAIKADLVRSFQYATEFKPEGLDE